MKLLLADDQGLFRECLAVAISTAMPLIQIVQAGTWAEVHALSDTDNTLMLLDLNMPSQQRWQSDLLSVRESCPNVPICILSSGLDQVSVQTSFAVGVRGYLVKTSSLEEMLRVIVLIAGGDIYLPTELFDAGVYNQQSKVQLTPRQQVILGLLSEGKSNKYIADLLGLAEGTVKRHVFNLFQALGAANRVEAVQLGRQLLLSATLPSYRSIGTMV